MKYENYENIKIIVELLKMHNIRNLVISPGGTNIPIIKKVQDDEFFHCYSVVDERSASYFAIGIYLQTREPVALICTSAQATRNYIPGLTEAFYKNVPVLAITMEKHPRFKYQGYMQAPDQTSLPNDCVKKSYELPFICDINDIYHSRRVINEALLELTHDNFGPVQLCVPWLDFPIKDVYPTNKVIKRINTDKINELKINDKKVLIIVGEHLPFSEEEKKAINKFCDYTNSVIYTNHLSNFKNQYSVDGNFLLSVISDNEFNLIKPNIIITIGGQTGDYPLYLRMSKTEYCDIEHWHIAKNGNVMDTYDKLTAVIQCREDEFFNSIKETKNVKHDYIDVWKEMIKKINGNDILLPYSNASIAQYLHDKIPNNSIMQFSILNSLRIWNLFEIDQSIECYSNVGAFGIDGGMSTMIGQSVITEKLCFMIIGDLAFLYDINSLAIRHIKNNLRIILINNNGGIEFKLNGENKEIVNKYIAASDHFRNAKGWAETNGFKYMASNTMEEFISNCKDFLGESDSSIIMEVFVNDCDESTAYHMLLDSNRKKDFKNNVKKIIKKIIK